MSSPQQGIYSTPLFELFRRGTTPTVIQRFRGINAYSTASRMQPDWALDLLNVIVTGSGGLSKFRLPIKLSVAIPGVNTGPNSFWDFQQANGTRQILANFNGALYFYSWAANSFNLVGPTLIDNNALNVGQWSFAIANNILFGSDGQRMMKWTGANWWLWGLVASGNAPIVANALAGLLAPTNGGWMYGFAWKNSVTGHCGNISSLTAVQNNPGTNFLTAAAPPDPQMDTIVWFRTIDGGGDPYRECEVNLNTGVLTPANSFTNVTVIAGTNNLQIADQSPDTGLDQTTRGPLINNPPLQGRFVAVGQSRVFVFNLIGSPQDVIYSGYEQILFGRPEESFPPNNRLRLSIGAESIAGGGVLQAGIVAFSQTGKMWMLRGQVEDISLLQPVNITQYLEELPWTLGCLSHFTIQSTPYGLIWVAGDKTVQLFDGHQAPIDISTRVYPLLRQITPGTETQMVSGYFNWLDRDWYVLLCAVNGSLSLNRLFFFVVNKQEDSNTIESVECFVSDVPNTLGGATWVGVMTTPKLQRFLCMGAQGFIQQLPSSPDTRSGIIDDETINPPTTGFLNAYWRSGYFGNDSPYRMKSFRWGRIVTDQEDKAFMATVRYVDDEQRKITAPEILGPDPLYLGKISMGRKAKRASVEINFPPQDAPANVLELQVMTIPTSDR